VPLPVGRLAPLAETVAPAELRPAELLDAGRGVVDVGDESLWRRDPFSGEVEDGILYGRVKCGLAATTGIHTSEDVLKVVMAGADAAMLCSVLYRNGTGHVATLLTGVEKWMTEHEYSSISEMKGTLSQRAVAEPAAYERANYMKTIQSFRPMV